MKKFLSLSFALLFSYGLFAQQAYMDVKAPDSLRLYQGDVSYSVKHYKEKPKGNKPKNIIFLIGDGMGTTQITAALTANKGNLYLQNFAHVGFSLTQSADNYVTDSAAGGTALACGERTNNGAIGVNSKGEKLESMLELAVEKGKATGLVSTSAITHATPASFIAHQPKRSMYEEIAGDFLNTNIDVFIGGGYNHFAKRKDGRNLIEELEKNGYTVLQEIDQIAKVKTGKLAGLTAPEHNPAMPKRGNMLPRATETALNILKQDKDGFFIMIEGSQIDWGGHANNTDEIVREMLDFDQAIGKALAFAAKDRETLVIVTADHETGGMALTNGSFESGMVEGEYVSHNHTATMVPVFSFGPGAEHFTGIMKNTDLANKLKSLINQQ